MPDGWVHAVIDLIAYGRPYFDLHKEKDDAYRYLGVNHRIIKHEWHNVRGKIWDFDDPFPSSRIESWQKLRKEKGAEKAEEKMSSDSHDLFDARWDTLSNFERKYWKGFFAWVLLNPEILKEWASVDVLDGRIQRLIENQEVWESCLELKSEYKRLRRYVEEVIMNDENLQDLSKKFRKMRYIPS
jgi:hypothetical protein